MAVTPWEFKTLFPEFGALPNQRLQVWLDQAELCVNRVVWGSKADLAVNYMAAHLLATFDGDKTASGSGPITQKKVGEVSASFGFSAEMLDSALASTKYGRHYRQLLRCIVAPRCI